MKKIITIAFILLGINAIAQNGGTCTFTLSDGTEICTVYGNAGMGSQNNCFNDAIAADAIATTCLDSPLTSCATWYATNGFGCFWGGLGSCGGTTGACEIVSLPVELNSFTADCQYVSWSTATESNNDYFVISGKNEGTDWIELEQKTGAGNSIELIEYRINANVARDYNYLKIHQVDYDGTAVHYKQIHLDCKEVRTIKSVYNSLGENLGSTVPVSKGMFFLLWSDNTSTKIINL